MREEEEVYDKVCRTMVTEDVTERKGGLAFGLTFVSEEGPKMPPPRLLESKKGEAFEKWKGLCLLLLTPLPITQTHVRYVLKI